MSGRSSTSIDDRTDIGSLLGYRKRLPLSYNSRAPFDLFYVYRDPDAGRHVEEAQKRRRKPVIDVRQPYERPVRTVRAATSTKSADFPRATPRGRTTPPSRGGQRWKRKRGKRRKQKEGLGGRSRRRISNWYW
ncbi:unnamed protein product [Lasius platythorax]|uniref:Uncharacterized protein n=1 Tax=Lasius platythorax TaxID=488582 RepID=A0AAV2PAL4_9HYME